MSDFLFAVPSGEPVALEPFHYAIIGQTQFSGKTTLIKRLSEWVATQGYRVLIYDTKEKDTLTITLTPVKTFRPAANTPQKTQEENSTETQFQH